jgi:diketogulonate reductase-like aldo/keto reductase
MDYRDLHLLHWLGYYPLAETVEVFEQLWAVGGIRYWGGLRHQGYNGTERIAGGRALCDQPSSIPSRGKRLRIQPVGVGPSPFDVGHCAFFRGQGGQLLRYQALITVARRNGATPGQIALARCLRSGGEIAIPKASTVTHVMENAGTAAIKLTIKG